jgi:hypothetical protein
MRSALRAKLLGRSRENRRKSGLGVHSRCDMWDSLWRAAGPKCKKPNAHSGSRFRNLVERAGAKARRKKSTLPPFFPFF